MNKRLIQVFEHEQLLIGESGFSQRHLDALLKLQSLKNKDYYKPVYKGVKFNQHVGIIQVQDLIIEILPKADKGNGYSAEQWRNALIQMLGICKIIEVDTLTTTYVNRNYGNLLELFYVLFLNEVEYLMRKGLIKKYKSKESNQSALKGKLVFAEHIRKNHLHKEQFFVRHQVYNKDHALHQIIKEAMKIVSQYSRGTEIAGKCGRILLDFPELDAISVNEATFGKISFNRKSVDYKRAIQLAEMIILNFSSDISKGVENMITIIFDMNMLWEEYIYRMLKRCETNDLNISKQESKTFWDTRTIRPDVVIRRGEEIFVLDTKWKRLKDEDAAMGDLRQMYAYNHFWNCRRSILLYPGSNKVEDFKTYQDPILENRTECSLASVNIFNEEGVLDLNIGEKILEMFKDEYLEVKSMCG